MNNCHNCEWLEWVEGEIHDPNGWACNKRNYLSEAQEEGHLDQLNSKLYRKKYKSCCDPKNK